MVERKINCWEYMRCGREEGGRKAAELGICPASADITFDGINFGKNAGRICWAVAGTFCGGRAQGSFAEKRSSCVGCAFFIKVQEEETALSQKKFLGFLSRGEGSQLLKGMTYKHIKTGERFITQGEVAQAAYIIDRGSCLVLVEREGELYPAGHRGKGDIVGELTLLTGEPQNAHMESETDMDVWVLSKAQFDNISRSDPEVLDFLTELVADRFDSRRPTADRTVGKYLATQVIGSGGYSIVYRGIHRALNMPVAIKMMRHNMALNPSFLRSFWNEGRIIARLNHENIIKVYDIEELYRTVFIIMELMDGESLKAMIDRLGRISPHLAANFLAQMCTGLNYAHKKGILHLDINPTNVFVQSDDRLKILDFGVAAPVGSTDRSIFDGTIYYTAPEQIRCERLDERTDVYSLGITAYEMITGGKPFVGDRVKSVMDMHLNQDVPDPAETVEDLPEPLRKFIIRACERDPKRRYPSMEEALRVLSPLVSDYQITGKANLHEDPIEILTREHSLIREFLDNLAIAANMLETGDRPPPAFFEKALQFARQFADKFHHLKEEHVMFAQLAQKKGGSLDGPIEALRHQHERGRNFVKEISNSLAGYVKGEETALVTLLENLVGYTHLLRHHIHKEDHQFFPAAKEAFSDDEMKGLAELFRREDEKSGGGICEVYQKLVQEMALLL
jgi:serine/threonine protein kinase